MKIILFACLLIGAYCDSVPVSSYSSLPYETDPGYFENSIHNYESQNYGYPERGKSKLAYHFGKMVKAPYNIVKGAGYYMSNVFSDLKGKLLQLKGSIARSKGNNLVAYGEELLRKANLFRGKYKHQPEPVHQFVQSYYSHNGPTYAQPKPIYGEPKPLYVAPKPSYVDPKPLYVEHKPSYIEPKPLYAESKPVYAHPQTGYQVPTSQFFASVNGGFSANTGRGFGSPKDSDVVPNSGFHPSHSVSYLNDNLLALGSEPVAAIEQLDNSIPEGRSDSGPSKQKIKNVVVVDVEPRKAASSYKHEDQRPIPVPVPIAIAPMKLVFPQLPY